MGIRRNAREAALQFLFQNDFLGTEIEEQSNLEQQFAEFCTLYDVQKKARAYAVQLLQGIIGKREGIDDAIRKHASNWRLERIDATDRNVLRIAVYEMSYQDDVPAEVAINEAVEIAKRYGSDESSSFVNGILDSVKEQLSTIESSPLS